MASSASITYQSAAIPLASGKVCLVRSSGGKRWVVPKGSHEPGKSLAEIALQEAWEEAGLVGILKPEPVGSYLYEKWSGTYHVTVFLMSVTESADEYPECMLRERCWLAPAQALRLINDPGLRAVLGRALRADLDGDGSVIAGTQLRIANVE
jgi:8-oxo-dGTP pyrophosphatase MutT (NUDIX family)